MGLIKNIIEYITGIRKEKEIETKQIIDEKIEIEPEQEYPKWPGNIEYGYIYGDFE